jgi:hypothetical protein
MIKIPDHNLYGEELTKYLHDEVWTKYTTERERLERLSLWTRSGQAVPYVAAQHRNSERTTLLEIARSPWMGLMVNTFSQQLIVDGYRKSGTTENAKAWDTWNRNDMAKQQFTLNRDILTYGYSYVKVTDSEDPLTGEPLSAIRVRSPKQVFAIYEDPYMDDWPKYVLERQPNGQYWWWSDEDYVVLDTPESKAGEFKVVEVVDHDYGLVPFVRYVNDIDADGRCWGDVEPVIEVARRIDKTKFDVLLTQHFTGFMVRWATGLQQPDNDPDIEKLKVRLSQENILASSNKDAKFGVLPPAPMDGLIEAYRESVKEFLTLTQLPSSLAGQMSNVAADALAAGNRPTMQKLWQKQAMFASGHNQVLRFVNMLEGRTEEAGSLEATKFSVHWQDVEIRSLAQFADAWGKMVQQLKIPAWGVWPMIPNIDQSTVEGWQKDAAPEGQDFKNYIRMLQESGPAGRGGAAGKDPRGGPNNGSNQQSPNNRNGEPASLNRQQPGAR